MALGDPSPGLQNTTIPKNWFLARPVGLYTCVKHLIIARPAWATKNNAYTLWYDVVEFITVVGNYIIHAILRALRPVKHYKVMDFMD